MSKPDFGSQVLGSSMLVRVRPLTGSDALPEPAGECHVWSFPLAPTARFWESLSADERDRAARYKFDRPREQFVAARGNLRQLLGRYLGVSPAAVELVPEPDGKPVVSGSGLHFNVTHSGAWGLIAVAGRRIGVDLEQLRDMPNAAGLVERFFGPEEREQFAALPDELKLAGFFRGWTGKEALLKAVGTGIQNVDKCVVDLDPRRPAAVVRFEHPAEVGAWRLAAWSPLPGYVAAVAVEAEAEILVG
jgi:4'-phosphopantetheinyl transferase